MASTDPFEDFGSVAPRSGQSELVPECNILLMDEKSLLKHLNAQQQSMSDLSQVAEGEVNSLSKKYIDQLISNYILDNPNTQIVLLSGCILADSLRINAPALPFPPEASPTAFKLFEKCFLIILEEASRREPSKYAHHLMACLADVHGMYAVCKQCFAASHSQIDDNILAVIKNLMKLGKQVSSMLCTTAGVISDIIISSRSMTEDVFKLLVSELMKQSTVAQFVFSNHAKQMQQLIHDHIMGVFSSHVHNFQQKPEPHEGNPRSSRNISHILELVHKIAKVNTRCVRNTVASLILHTENENPEIRAALVKGLGKIFDDEPTLLLESQNALQTFIARLSDTRPVVRNEMLRLVYKMLRTKRDNQIQEQLWKIFADPLVTKLVDVDESVRRNSVLMITSMDLLTVPPKVLQAVGERCRDKKRTVRHLAISQLAKSVSMLCNSDYMSWIPNTVLQPYHADDDSNRHVVETALYTMLESYSESFGVFCGHLDTYNFDILREIVSRMFRLRRVVVKLFEMKRCKADEDSASKLIFFLSNQLPVDNTDALEEWKTISEVKDHKFIRTIEQRFVFAEDLKETLQHVRRIWRKSTCDYFGRVLLRILLPIGRNYATSLGQTCQNLDCQNIGEFRSFYLMRLYEPPMFPSIAWVAQNALSCMHEKSDEKMHHVLALMFGFVLEPTNQSAEILTILQTQKFIETLMRICFEFSRVNYSLCKSAAKVIAQFLSTTEPHYTTVMKLLRSKHEALPATERTCSYLIYKQIIEKGKLAFGKDYQINESEVMNDIHASQASDDVASASSLAAAMRLMKAFFEAQHSVHKENVITYMTQLLRLASSLTHIDKPNLSESKRLAILKSLVGLIRSPKIRVCIFDAMHLLQGFAESLSEKDTKENRAALQKKLFHHLYRTGELPLQCTAFLLFTALAETDRHNLSKLREYVRVIVQKYRDMAIQQMASKRITLSDERAVAYYPEYIFPILLYLLAHSRVFVNEAEKSYLSIQRVFVIYFEEVLGQSNESASFLTALIQVIRSHDDRYDLASLNTRILCDVALLDLQEILNTRSVQADNIHTFPGEIQLPHFFAKPSPKAQSYDTQVLLCSDFNVIRTGFGGLLSCVNAKNNENQIADVLNELDKEALSNDTAAAKIAAVVKEKYGHLDADDVALISWKTMRKEIAVALGSTELSEEERKIAWQAVETLHTDEL